MFLQIMDKIYYIIFIGLSTGLMILLCFKRVEIKERVENTFYNFVKKDCLKNNFFIVIDFKTIIKKTNKALH